jgi:hypothetical protein
VAATGALAILRESAVWVTAQLPGARVPRVDVIDELLANNLAFAASLLPRHLDVRPSRRLAVVTCMDSRLDVFAALGLGTARRTSCATPAA